MRIHLIKRQTIENFARNNTGSRSSFFSWLAILKNASWNKPADILKTFNSADLLGKNTNRIIFDIAGNKYRMICKYYFGKSKVRLFVCWIGTHAEYTKLCNDQKQYTVNNF